MTAPDYGKCWDCGAKTTTQPHEGIASEWAYWIMCDGTQECKQSHLMFPVALWKCIHDRLAAVREEERERCAKQIDKDIDELFPQPGPERAIGHTLAALIRKGD